MIGSADFACRDYVVLTMKRLWALRRSTGARNRIMIGRQMLKVADLAVERKEPA
jgi:hypothetical protein